MSNSSSAVVKWEATTATTTMLGATRAQRKHPGSGLDEWRSGCYFDDRDVSNLTRTQIQFKGFGLEVTKLAYLG